jgi:uncharacterized protein (UPF0261 family)
MAEKGVAVLATLDNKSAEARFVCDVLAESGAAPLLIDMSLRPHRIEGAGVSGGEMAMAGGVPWDAMAEMDRAEAAEAMVAGGIAVLLDKCRRREISGAIALGGANGTSMACDMMRALPPLFPKVMVSTMAGTPAVEWYVGESDIVMFPSIGDILLNRLTRTVMEHAAWSVAAMVEKGRGGQARDEKEAPLIGVSSFGGTSGCVDRVTERLAAEGYEVIHFHTSGPGGKTLEYLARSGQLAGVVDVTTHELADLAVGGVFSAGDGRLRSAGRAGLPQVVVPGAIDHANFWVGRVPEEFKDREFFRFNKTNILMRTNAEEFEVLGRIVAERLNAAEGPFAVLVPTRGFSEHTKRMTQDLQGRELGPWKQPAVDAVFTRSLRRHLQRGRVEELDLHVNEPAFADACIDAFLEMMKR